MDYIYYVKNLLRHVTSSSLRTKVKRVKRHLKQILSKEKKNSLDDFRYLLEHNLGIKKGDWLLVSSSFGNLNADFTPRQAIELLQSIVTEEGLIMMPYYPPMNSTEWANHGYVFDMLETKSGMGVLTNVFSEMPNVYKSIHPTKAVCCWGACVGNVLKIDQHINSTTPFYWDSPYGELLKHDSKSLCLGLKNIPIIHAIEDVLSDHYDAYYYPTKKKLKIRLADRSEIEAETYVHNPTILDRCVPPGDYVRNINPHSYLRVPFGLKYVVVVDNKDLFYAVKQQFIKGNTRFCE